jgi:hypothetical protein
MRYLILVCFITQSLYSHSQTAEDYFREGLEKLEAKEYKEAIESGHFKRQVEH